MFLAKPEVWGTQWRTNSLSVVSYTWTQNIHYTPAWDFLSIAYKFDLFYPEIRPGTSTPGQRGPGSDGNKGVSHTLRIIWTGPSPSYAVYHNNQNTNYLRDLHKIQRAYSKSCRRGFSSRILNRVKFVFDIIGTLPCHGLFYDLGLGNSFHCTWLFTVFV